MAGLFVAYQRVSTDAQGRSGLGLEAQQAAIAGYLKPGDRLAAPPFIEIESGKSASNRPQLAAAMRLCRLTGACLLVAKLDRLSRDAHFLIGLDRADLDWRACDMPNANRLTTGIMALVAQQEREAISTRTKEALAAAKARGIRLGGYRGGPVPDAAKGGQTVAAKADAFAAQVLPLVHELVAQGLSHEGIARQLTARNVRTARRGAWTGQTVRNVLARGAGQ